MRYRDFRFGTKQMIGFGLILLIMSGMNLLSLREMETLKTELDEVSTNWLPRAITLADLNLNTSNLRANQLQYAIAPDSVSRKIPEQHMIAFIGKIEGDRDTYDALIKNSAQRTLDSPEERGLYDTFELQWETYQDLSFAFLDHSIAKETDEAIALLNGEGQVVFNEFSATLASLIEVNRENAVAAAERAEITILATRRLTRTLLGATIILSLVIAFVLVRVVTVPLGHLVKAVDQVAKGELDVQLDIQSKDEIGQLAQSFNAMTVGLREAQHRIEREAALRAEAAELRAKAREAETKALKAENARKTHELEEARALQLSMLPTTLPDVPDLDIAVYMKTATEVGGDYYDFMLEEDGMLTIAVGDATGHGLQAGTIVTATKSLFNAFATDPNPVHFFRKVSPALKEMGLRKMYMAMTLAKIKDRTLRLSAAGMPYTLIYRAETKTVEEIVLKGMPLGSFVNFPYQQKELHLQTGDTVLFMSDGIPERFNDQNEMFGEARTMEVFAEGADKPPKQLIAHLVERVDTWANGRVQEDDATLVALKVKEAKHG